MTDLRKLKTKVGTHEFEAEGSEEFVSALFKQFLLSIESQAGAPVNSGITAASAKPAPMEDQSSLPAHKSGGETKVIDEIARTKLNKIFRSDEKKHETSLRFLPKTGKSETSDSILLLVYGFHFLVGIEEVPVIKLKQAAVQSGLRIDRLDRHTETSLRRSLLIKTGLGKGGKYRLTNSGLAVADKLAEEMVAHVI